MTTIMAKQTVPNQPRALISPKGNSKSRSSSATVSSCTIRRPMTLDSMDIEKEFMRGSEHRQTIGSRYKH